MRFIFRSMFLILVAWTMGLNKMALAGIKLDSDSGGFISNCFPVRGILRRDVHEGDGAWLIAHRAEQRRRFRALLCSRPRTGSRLQEERKKSGKQRVQVEEDEDGESERPVLDGYFLMKHCCVDDPAHLCSVNIAGLELSEAREEDFDIFDSVVYVNAGENYLPFDTFRRFPSLRELEMPLNGLCNLKIQMNDFPHLEIIDLSYNNLCNDDILALGQLSALHILHLTGNNLSTLPPDMSLPCRSDDRKIQRQRFSNLEVLLLDNNNLADISVFAALAGLPRLHHINMEKNKISYIPQLKCIEGHVVTHDIHPQSAKKYERRAKSCQSGARSASKESAKRLDSEALSCSELSAAAEEKNEGKEWVKQKGILQQPASSLKDEPAVKTEIQDDFNLAELLEDEFNLGELDDRITELEEETTKVMETEEKPVVTQAEDISSRVLLPFPQLRYLNLAYNQIREEEALLAVAAWPLLVHLVIHDNPLTTTRQGDPPLLTRFLSEHLGIRLQRKHEPRFTKPNIDIQRTKSRTVSEIVPKIPRSTIEERLRKISLEGPQTTSESWNSGKYALSGLDLETSKRMPLPPILPSPPVLQSVKTQAWSQKEKKESSPQPTDEEAEKAHHQSDSNTFFMTQVDDQDEEPDRKQPSNKSENSAETDQIASGSSSKDQRYKGYELLLDSDSDVEMEVQLPKDIQGNVRALKHALRHSLVYRDTSVDLKRIKRTVPEFRRMPVPPAKLHKSRQERIDNLLENLRTQSTMDEEKLSSVLKDSQTLGKQFPGAEHLVAQVQRRYNIVRVSSLKKDTRKIIELAFEVLNKSKQTYEPVT